MVTRSNLHLGLLPEFRLLWQHLLRLLLPYHVGLRPTWLSMLRKQFLDGWTLFLAFHGRKPG